MYPNSFGPRCWGDQHFHWNHPQQLQWQDRCQAGVRGSWANGRCQNEVSSAHRRAALEATHWAIDELKATVPIWKKEFFEDGSLWKENAESRPVDQPGPAQE
eukprot:GHRR01013342.1.p2 GENE.GHRR01013342.1~~GHRR01013342.1.p2  ORF type:complete len:102 (+),score=6.99 GHRR01013342.1:533-838(+)